MGRGLQGGSSTPLMALNRAVSTSIASSFHHQLSSSPGISSSLLPLFPVFCPGEDATDVVGSSVKMAEVSLTQESTGIGGISNVEGVVSEIEDGFRVANIIVLKAGHQPEEMYQSMSVLQWILQIQPESAPTSSHSHLHSTSQAIQASADTMNNHPHSTLLAHALQGPLPVSKECTLPTTANVIHDDVDSKKSRGSSVPSELEEMSLEEFRMSVMDDLHDHCEGLQAIENPVVSKSVSKDSEVVQKSLTGANEE